jgi:hypothetical protein
MKWAFSKNLLSFTSGVMVAAPLVPASVFEVP